jgi:hypothetical protein
MANGQLYWESMPRKEVYVYERKREKKNERYKSTSSYG